MLLARLKLAFLKWLGLEPIREISIGRDVVEDLCEMARSAHPKEMLAFLSARGGVRSGRLHIDEIQLQAYDAGPDSAHTNLWMLPSFSTIVGTVHSHPGGGVRPSDADLNFWTHYGFVHAILAEPYRPSNIVFYDKEGERITVRVVP